MHAQMPYYQVVTVRFREHHGTVCLLVREIFTEPVQLVFAEKTDSGIGVHSADYSGNDKEQNFI